MDYLVIIDKFPTLKKKEINDGFIPKIATEISSILHSVFLLSNNMREQNSLNIICINHFNEEAKNSILIQINGSELRYLSPDERVTILLLEKIFMVIQGISTKKLYRKKIHDFKLGKIIQSTPGIKIQKVDAMQYWTNIEYENYILIDYNKDLSNCTGKITTESNLESIISHIALNDELSKKSLIIFNLSVYRDILKNIKGNIIIFQDDKVMNRFFTWDIINLIEILNDYTHKFGERI